MIDYSHPVVIDFTQQASPFEQLWPTTHRALLPVIGKPMLVHLLERLRNSGYRHFRIARHLQQPFVKNRLGNGQEWGVTLRYSDLPGAELINETLMCFGETAHFFGDQLIDRNVDFDSVSSARLIQDCRSVKHAGLFRLSDGALSFRPLVGTHQVSAELGTVAEYQEVCFRYCSQFALADTAPGAQLHRSAQSDWKTKIAPDVLVGESCFVGKHCKLGRGAVLAGNCVLGNGVYVDKGARLRNCVVLPNTYIGKNVELSDCVASARGAVHISGDYAPAPTASMLGSTRPNREETTGLPRDIKKFTQA